MHSSSTRVRADILSALKYKVDNRLYEVLERDFLSKVASPVSVLSLDTLATGAILSLAASALTAGALAIEPDKINGSCCCTGAEEAAGLSLPAETTVCSNCFFKNASC